jgi:hypothetical protein
MTLGYFIVRSGRDIELTNLAISSTYGGFLEGYPNGRMNDALLAGLAKRESARVPPKHVIQPARSGRERSENVGAFGAVETLPGVICTASFVSHPVDEDLDSLMHRSWLTVVWFQESIDDPVERFVSAAVADLDWERLAEDIDV